MPFGQAGAAYDAAVLELLQRAYNGACGEIGIEPYPSNRSDQETRQALARAIMDLAATGLRDPHILRERALQRVTKPPRHRPAAAP